MAVTGVKLQPASSAPKSGDKGIASWHEQKLLREVVLLMDFLVGGASLWMALRLRAMLPILHGPMNLQTLGTCGGLFLLILLLVAAGFRSTGLPSNRPETFHILQSGLYATISTLTFLFLLRRIGQDVSRPTVIFFAVFFTLGLVASHKMSAYWYRHYKLQRPHQILILGDLERSRRFVDASISREHWRVLDVISDRLPGHVHGIMERLTRAIREQAVDTILLVPSFMTAEAELAGLYRQVTELCALTGVRLQIHAEWLDEYSHIYLDHIGAEPVLTYSFSPDLSWPLLAKRALDITLSALFLLLAAPLLLLVALGIKLDSRGPVFFVQDRAGLRGRPFYIYKFRTMIADAEVKKTDLLRFNELTGPTFKMASDPRITRFGRWLRKSSLDELPQLWNVLRGDMSLVGPRPHPVREVSAYHDSHIRRLSMKPGITGLWQISGRTSITDFERWVELDAQYIREWSLWLDCKILLRTGWVVLRMTGQ